MKKNNGLEEFFNSRSTKFDSYSDWVTDPFLFEKCTEPLKDMMPEVKCLDLGGGTGWIANTDSERSSRDWTIIDISNKMAAKRNENVKYIQGDMQNTLLPSQSFSHIITRSTLQYVDVKKVFNEVKRLLTRRGTFVLAQKVYPISNQVDKQWFLNFSQIRNPGFINLFQPNDLESILVECEMKVLKKYNYRTAKKIEYNDWITKCGVFSKEKQDVIENEVKMMPQSVKNVFNFNIENGIVSFTRDWEIIVARPDPQKNELKPVALSIIVESEINGEKCILLQKRKKRYREPQYFNFWELPQGKMDKGETLEQTLQRELYEETTLEIEEYLDKVEKFDDFHLVQPFVSISTFDTTDFYAIAIRVKAKGTPFSIDVNREFNWLPTSNLSYFLKNEDIFPLNKPMLDYYDRKVVRQN